MESRSLVLQCYSMPSRRGLLPSYYYNVTIQGLFTIRARGYQNFNAVLFVATGIGATQFTSIIHKGLQQCNPAGRQYYLHWVVKEQVAAQTWSAVKLQDVENASKDLKIEMTGWITGAEFLKGKGSCADQIV